LRSTGIDAPAVRLGGWLRAVTWLFAVLIGLAFVAALLMLLVGPDQVQQTTGARVVMPDFSLWWGVSQLIYLTFGVGCAALLFGDRDLGGLAVPAAWAIVAIQLIDALRGLGVGKLAIPVSAPLFAAYAIAVSRALRKRAAPKTQREAGAA
jgi:hypothetical protein